MHLIDTDLSPSLLWTIWSNRATGVNFTPCGWLAGWRMVEAPSWKGEGAKSIGAPGGRVDARVRARLTHALSLGARYPPTPSLSQSLSPSLALPSSLLPSLSLPFSLFLSSYPDASSTV